MRKAFPTKFAPFVVIVGFTALSFSLFANGHSPDLQATWLAGHFFAQGAMDQIYPGETELFTMLPPTHWWPYLEAEGRHGSVFPYIYPPLWAAISGVLSDRTTIDGFQVAASVVNPLLMGAMFLIAGRMSGARELQLLFHCVFGLAVMLIVWPGAVALEQNQPQILVSFLILFAFERDRAGAARTAGSILALAAAIKLYPAVFALVWLAGRRWNSALSFIVVGALLGGLSVLLTGWTLHQVFLGQVNAVRETVLVSNLSYGFDAAIAQLFFADDFTFVAGLDNPDGTVAPAGWFILQKSAVWSACSTVALCLVLIAAMYRQIRNPDPFDLPVLVIAVALVSPLSWGYHYLPALAFLPVLLPRFGVRTGGFLTLVIVMPLTIASFGPLSSIGMVPMAPQIAGTLSMIVLGFALFFAPSDQSEQESGT